jgi:hypothetical protein
VWIEGQIATQDPLLALVDLARGDMPRYAELVLKIRTKQAKLDPLKLNKAQRLVHERLEKQKKETGRVRALILKARQEGISTYVAARFWHQVALYPNIVALIVADQRKRSEKLWDIYQRYFDRSPEFLRPDRKVALRRQEFIFGHESQIEVDTAEDPDLGRAATYHLLHASELAAWQRAEDAWLSVLQAVPQDGSEVIVESTAQGVGNLFHRLWEAAEAKETEWLPIFLPWWIHEEYRIPKVAASLEEEIRESGDPFEREAQDEGILFEGEPHKLDVHQLAWRRQVLRDNFYGDKLGFQQENPATATEAFITAEGGFFDAQALNDYDKLTRPPIAAGLMAIRKDAVVFGKTDRGPISIWERPRKDGHYVIGCDTASGRLIAARAIDDSDRAKRDFSVAMVLDPTRRKLVASLHARMAPEAFADQTAMLGRWYGCRVDPDDPTVPALIAVERNHSSGQTVLRRLKDIGYRNLFWHRQINYRHDRASPNLGWITNANTRRPMLDLLAEALREGTVELPDKALLREMRTFVLRDDGEPAAQEQCHDDRVIAAAIALEMCRRHRHPATGSVVAEAFKELEKAQETEFAGL